MINLARGNYQLERIRFESLNPTFLVVGRLRRRDQNADRSSD